MSLFITTRQVLRWRMKETACRYGGLLIYCMQLSGQLTRWCSSARELGEGLTTLKNSTSREMLHKAWDMDRFFRTTLAKRILELGLISKEHAKREWTGFLWLRIGTVAGSYEDEKLRSNKMQGISWITQNLPASLEVRCSLELMMMIIMIMIMMMCCVYYH